MYIPFSVDNFVLLARLGDKYQTRLALDLCETFVEDEQLPFDNTQITNPQLLAMLRAVVEFEVGQDNMVMVKLLMRAATLSVAELIEHEAHIWLPSRATAALFLAAQKNELTEAATAVTFLHHEFRDALIPGFCGICKLTRSQVKKRCNICSKYVCSNCEKLKCRPSSIVEQLTTPVYLACTCDINEKMLG